MLSQLNKDQLIEKYCIAIVFVMKLWCRLKDDSGFRSILKVTLELAVKIAGGHYISHMTLIPSDNINKMQWKNKLNIVVDQKHNRNEKLWIKPGRSYQSAGLRAKHSFSRFYTLNIWHNLTVTENLDYVYMVDSGFTVSKMYHFRAHPWVLPKTWGIKEAVLYSWLCSLLETANKCNFCFWAHPRIALTKGPILCGYSYSNLEWHLYDSS